MLFDDSFYILDGLMIELWLQRRKLPFSLRQITQEATALVSHRDTAIAEGRGTECSTPTWGPRLLERADLQSTLVVRYEQSHMTSIIGSFLL